MAGLIFANLLYKAQVTGYMLFNAEAKVQNLLASIPSSSTAGQPAKAAANADPSLPAMSTEQQQQQQQELLQQPASLLGGEFGAGLQGSSSAGSVMVGGAAPPEEVMKLQGLIKITTSVSEREV